MSVKKSFCFKVCKLCGFEDCIGDVLRVEQYLIFKVSQVYDDWGFEFLQMLVFEYVEVLGKFLLDEECLNEGVFVLEDDDGQWMLLCYDYMVLLVCFVVEYYQDLNKFYCCYQVGDVWWNEKLGLGCFW